MQKEKCPLTTLWCLWLDLFLIDLLLSVDRSKSAINYLEQAAKEWQPKTVWHERDQWKRKLLWARLDNERLHICSTNHRAPSSFTNNLLPHSCKRLSGVLSSGRHQWRCRNFKLILHLLKILYEFWILVTSTSMCISKVKFFENLVNVITQEGSSLGLSNLYHRFIY